jgi:hypothetical protein
METEAGVTLKNKLKKIIIITSVLSLIFVAIVVKEYAEKRRIDRASKYYSEAGVIGTLAALLRADLKCTDNKGESLIIEKDKNMARIVERDISDYIDGEKKSLYKYTIIEDEDTKKYIDIFNDNMQHIRISKKDSNGNFTPAKTISEEEGLEEFKEIKDLDELTKYMYKKTENGAYYIYALEFIGSDNYDFKGKIIYERDGIENIIYEDRDIRIWDLFSKIYKDYQ